MSLQTKLGNISWVQFETYNQDFRTAFEKMCRLLFNRYFFDNRALLHSNPNNPGVEVEPILETKSNKRISFQAKYFTSIDYEQIKHSAKQTIKYYSGQLDIFYVYCNKDLNTTSKPYKEIETLLDACDIELVPINNQTILDQVINNPVIAALYFNHGGLTNNWFNEHLKLSLESLGPRYNNQFNVETKTQEYIDLFTQTDQSIAKINQKKSDAVKFIQENFWRYRNYKDLVNKICDTINLLNDITIGNIQQCFEWSSTVKDEFSIEFIEINNMINDKKTILKNSPDQLENQRRHELEREIRGLQYIADIPLLLELDETEQNLLTKKVLIIQGDAGAGKSHMFADVAKSILQSTGHTLLLLGNTFISNDPITQQIPLLLELNLNIDEFLNILEGIGEEENHFVVIFIDAINESANKDIWKTGLIPLFNKLNKLNYVRLALSVRTGYENLVFDEVVHKKIKNNEVFRLIHYGFREESVEATRTFLNYYNIPFAPSYFLQYEMTNPLFLTLFCQTYNGEDFDIYTLFEKIIEKTDREAQLAVGLDGSLNILKYLIDEIAEFQLSQNKKMLTKKEFFQLDFWSTYGLSNIKIPYTAALERAGLLINSIYDKIEFYFLGYNLLEDYVCAKLIINKHTDKETLKNYLVQNLLRIENGEIINHSNHDIFIAVCSLYAEKYNEECIDIINNLNEEYEKNNIAEEYIESYHWRKTSTIERNVFMHYINHHAVRREIVWQLFIENSIKPNHPLNAEFLHTVLIKKSISKRDYLWTTYINYLADDDSRLYQLINFFEKGETFDSVIDSNIILILILFTWLLTSSNRFLRDKASKAMIELLKTNFQMCLYLLKKFETINDPYVIQRLYGIVFGACMKRTEKYKLEFTELAEYIFNTIFNKETVYPDILLRDYARLVLERFLYEFPQYSKIINVVKIRPPYLSAEIPSVEKEEYFQAEAYNSGFNFIARSMHPDRINGPGIYGDFGRYVFQSTISDFDEINMENLYHYAMQYIRDELGYDNKLFSDHDTFLRHHDRHQTRKIERIGKKYQWITLYNILARISDRHKLKIRNEKTYSFEGAWKPYIRDFDPTLNCNFLIPDILPQFDLSENDFDKLFFIPSSDESEIENWAKATCEFFDDHNFKLILKDQTNQTWILLNQYENLSNKENFKEESSIYNESTEIWSMSHAYVVKDNEFELFKKELEKKNFWGKWFPEESNVYQVFNLEYYWSPSFQHFFDDPWINYEVETGEKIIIKHTGRFPKFMNLKNKESNDIDDIITLQKQDWEEVISVKKTFGQVMQTYLRFLWEEQYDASQQEAISFDIPCRDIVDFLQLKQKEYDGYFYSEDGSLVSFDGTLAKICNGFLIRKDYLDRYLHENGLRLVWTCLGEKHHSLDTTHHIFGEWSGFYYLQDDKIIGTMENKLLE